MREKAQKAWEKFHQRIAALSLTHQPPSPLSTDPNKLNFIHGEMPAVCEDKQVLEDLEQALKVGNYEATVFTHPELPQAALKLFCNDLINREQISSILELEEAKELASRTLISTPESKESHFAKVCIYPIFESPESNQFSKAAKWFLLPFLRYYSKHLNNLSEEQFSFFKALMKEAPLSEQYFFTIAQPCKGDKHYKENEVIGCTSALIIVIYGVLAGFATSALITNGNNATAAMQYEANTVANLYRESEVLTQPTKKDIQAQLKHYTIEVLEVEWPLMNEDKIIKSNAPGYLQQLTQLLAQYKAPTPEEGMVLKDMLTHTGNLYDAHQQRIQCSYTSLSSEIWIAIIIGTILALCVSYLFGVHFYLHIFIVTAAALMAASVLFLLIGLDKPFVGQYAVGPEAIRDVMEAIKI